MATKLEKEIIQKMDGKTSFGKIGQQFGLSYQTIKSIATIHGIKRPISVKKQKLTIEEQALELLKDINLSRVDIASKLGIGVYALRKITKKHNIKTNRAFIDRNKKITELIKAGVTYPEIGKQFNMTKQRVYQFAKNAGISRWNDIREDNERYSNSVRIDVENGMSYSDIKEKHQLTKNHHKLVGSGLSNLSTKFRKKRDSGLLSEYKVKSAIKVINTTELTDPNRVNTVDSLYRIASKSGFKKYPQIGNRSAGGLFEDKKVIKFIKDKKNAGLSFVDITTLLNVKGFKTITGKEFTTGNVYAKYNAIKKHNK